MLLNAVDKSLYHDNILYVMVVGVALPVCLDLCVIS